jgi:hypothetical protein
MQHAGAMVTASQDGSVTVRSMDALQCFSRITAHDQSRGGCVEACISMDKKHLITVGRDAMLNVYTLDLQNFNSAVRAAVAMPTSTVEEPPLFVVNCAGRSEQTQALLDESTALAPIAEDICDPQAYRCRAIHVALIKQSRVLALTARGFVRTLTVFAKSRRGRNRTVVGKLRTNTRRTSKLWSTQFGKSSVQFSVSGFLLALGLKMTKLVILISAWCAIHRGKCSTAT